MLDDYEWLFSWLWEQKQIATGGSSVLTRATFLQRKALSEYHEPEVMHHAGLSAHDDVM